jgi:transcriptional regulator with XRE-family HTH domain
VGTLREERVRRLLTVRSLAEQAGVAPTTVHLIETGRRRPQFLTIERLSRTLAIDPMEVTEFRIVLDAAARPPVQGKAHSR